MSWCASGRTPSRPQTSMPERNLLLWSCGLHITFWLCGISDWHAHKGLPPAMLRLPPRHRAWLCRPCPTNIAVMLAGRLCQPVSAGEPTPIMLPYRLACHSVTLLSSGSACPKPPCHQCHPAGNAAAASVVTAIAVIDPSSLYGGLLLPLTYLITPNPPKRLPSLVCLLPAPPTVQLCNHPPPHMPHGLTPVSECRHI